MPAIVRVDPKRPNSTHDIRLSDGVESWGITLADGIRSFQEVPSSPSTMAITSGGQRYGDYEPGFSHLDQRDWRAGRGYEFLVDEKSGFFDSQNLWTLDSGKMYNAPQWKIARGLRSADRHLPGSVTWKKLIGSEAYIATSFAASASYSADKAYLWVRRRGSPGTLTVTLRSDNSGSPGTVLQTVTKTIADITDTVSLFEVFNWSGTESLTSTTTYWICVSSSGTSSSHWQVGVDIATSSAKSSADGSTWATASYKLYFRVVDADIDRRFWLFRMESAWYAVDSRADGTASHLYINGARGTATTGAASSITDTNASFGTDSRYIGARVAIIEGTGAGQDRQIGSHTGTVITVTSNWSVTPDNTSRYVVYDTGYWNEISTTGLGKVVSRPAVCGKIAYFPQGESVNIRRMRNNATSHDFADDSTNKASFIYLFYSTADKAAQVWRANNASTGVSVSRSVTKVWGIALAFGTAIQVGSTDYLITNLFDHNNQLHIFKEDSIWLEGSDTVVRMNIAMGSAPSSYNGQAVVTKDLQLYFSFLHSCEYCFNGNIGDFGPDTDSGIPASRKGPIACFDANITWTWAAIDAVSGTSSVMIFNGIGWHEIFRAPQPGMRIREVKYQSVENGKPKLWIDCGGDLYYQDYPAMTSQPLRDTAHQYQHEGVFVSSTIDAGLIDLPKFYKELTLTTEKLTTGMEIGIDIQFDEDINTDNWTPIQSVVSSQKGVSAINYGNKYKLRYRMRINTNNVLISPVVVCPIIKCFARTPVKRQWNVRADVNDLAQVQGRPDKDADQFYKWLWDISQSTKGVLMNTRLESVNNLYVVIEPPTITRTWLNTLNSKWGSYILFTIREA